MQRKVTFSNAAVVCKRCLQNNATFSRKDSLFERLKSVVCSNAGSRQYHSDNGVYGHRPKSPEEYDVPEEALNSRINQSNFFRLVSAYRELGHKTAKTNPVDLRQNYSDLKELNPARFGLSATEKLDYKGVLNVPQSSGSVTDVIDILKSIYCEFSSAEFTYLETELEREWFASRFEGIANEQLSVAERVEIAQELMKSQTWDNFLAVKFPNVKRYGGEGAEGMMAFFTELFKLSSRDTIEKVVLGMPHRGKLNVLTGLLQCPPVKIFLKFRGLPEFSADTEAMCDIAQHFSVSLDFENEDGNGFTLSMLNNPSHLEVVNPVTMGKARSKQQDLKEGDYSDDPNSRLGDKVINVQLHGDAAFSGQGINQECLMLAQTPNFDIGGSIHVIINNQIGFTTPGERGRSSRYCSDLAKSVNAPVIHVNADHPELVAKATRVAFEYQRKFRKDIFIDLNCWRRWGHNEVDDPTFTNPLLYKLIINRRSVPDLYSEKLIEEGVWTKEDADKVVAKHTEWLASELKALDQYQPDKPYFQKQWAQMAHAPSAIETWDTGTSLENLNLIGIKSVQYPSDFAIHHHIKKSHVTSRLSKMAEGKNLDWSTAEALAIGSLLLEGHNVRLSGEDVGRGTFSNRHIMLVDQESNDIFIPLNSIIPEQKAFLEVANSILSEEAVLGYEYGMAADQPNNLIIWESQFGDFFNGAQIMIDTYIASGETKWMKSNGLVILLPHGYDGAGAEHSSSRMERFLQMTDSKENQPDGENINMQVVNCHQAFAVLPPLEEAGDEIAEPLKVKKVIITSGKHYYALDQERKSKQYMDVAILRLESLCPFPLVHLQVELDKYKNAKTFVWSQEEPRNMGAWTFIKPPFRKSSWQKVSLLRERRRRVPRGRRPQLASTGGAVCYRGAI